MKEWKMVSGDEDFGCTMAGLRCYGVVAKYYSIRIRDNSLSNSVALELQPVTKEEFRRCFYLFASK